MEWKSAVMSCRMIRSMGFLKTVLKVLTLGSRGEGNVLVAGALDDGEGGGARHF